MLEVTEITAGYAASKVLRDVSLTVPEGSAVALLGPNGAGKSTLLRSISGFIKPTNGKIRFDGRDVTGSPPSAIALAGLCLLPEGRGIFPSLSVRENLILQAPKGDADRSIETAVKLFPPLGTRLKQMAGSLSGGEQQMLAFVRAYVSNPKLVMVDEASLGLSPIMVQRVFDTFREILGRGAALLIVEQYVNRALDLADSVYLLNHGRIVFSGPSSELNAESVFEHYLGVDVGPTA